MLDEAADAMQSDGAGLGVALHGHEGVLAAFQISEILLEPRQVVKPELVQLLLAAAP